MQVIVLEDPEAVARRGAALIAGAAREAIAQRGRFVFAASGGRTPWRMFRVLAAQDLPWGQVHVVQVDERVVPEGSPERNWTQLEQCLPARRELSAGQRHPMPVDDGDLAAAAARYAAALRSLCGSPAVLDLVQLGLGADGHTASLVPRDAVLEVHDTDVALTGPYAGRVRMTLTFPVIDRSRRILWIVTGDEKAAALARLCAADTSLPAGRVARERAVVLADRAAAAGLGADAPGVSWE